MKSYFGFAVVVYISCILWVGSQAQSCDSNKGTCIDINKESCVGTLHQGYCPGPSTVQCCEPTPCDGNKGVCVDTKTQSCDGILRQGYCPGASNIQCCEPTSDLPQRCDGSGPTLPNDTFEYTLKNQGIYCID